MDVLIKARSAVKRQVTTFKNYLNRVIASSSDTTQALEQVKRLELKERINSARRFYDKYDEIQVQIDEKNEDSDAREKDVEYREGFEEEYYSALAQAEMLLARGNIIQAVPSTSNAEMQNAATQPQISQLQNEGVFDPQRLARQTNQNIIFKQPGIRLPTIELPKFKGDIAEW